MRRIERVERLAGETEWDLAREFVMNHLWPYFVTHAPNTVADPHYHRTDEEFQVLAGSMTTFFDLGTAAGEGIEFRSGDRGRIPEGTVHRVTIGPEGVTYVMGLGRPTTLEEFSVFLPAGRGGSIDELAKLVDVNYYTSGAEELGDIAAGRFEENLSERFVFAGALGDQSMTYKRKFIEGLEGRKDKGRRSNRPAIAAGGAGDRRVHDGNDARWRRVSQYASV